MCWAILLTILNNMPPNGDDSRGPGKKHKNGVQQQPKSPKIHFFFFTISKYKNKHKQLFKLAYHRQLSELNYALLY